MATPLSSTNLAYTGTSTYTRPQDPYSFYNAPAWSEPAADSIADAISASGEAAKQLADGAAPAARAVLNLLADLPDPRVMVEDNEITLEWYKDKNHVAVLAVDGEFVTWAIMAGAGNPLIGKERFYNQLPQSAIEAVSFAIVG
jgi:hypothetical protein